MPQKSHLSHLTIPQLQEQLKRCWVRYSEDLKAEMAESLYFLRLKIKKPGSRNGEGFGNWVEENLGISKSTANRWADDYAVEKGAMKPRKPKPTSPQTNRSGGDDARDSQVTLQLILTPEERASYNDALQILSPEEVDRLITECSQLILKTIVDRAADLMDEQAKAA